MNILRHSAVVGIIALGMGLVVITGQIDLSVGSMLAVRGRLRRHRVHIRYQQHPSGAASPPWRCGALCGLINGVLVGRAKMPAFIATLATMLILPLA